MTNKDKKKYLIFTHNIIDIFKNTPKSIIYTYQFAPIYHRPIIF